MAQDLPDRVPPPSARRGRVHRELVDRLLADPTPPLDVPGPPVPSPGDPAVAIPGARKPLSAADRAGEAFLGFRGGRLTKTGAAGRRPVEQASCVNCGKTVVGLRDDPDWTHADTGHRLCDTGSVVSEARPRRASGKA